MFGDSTTTRYLVIVLLGLVLYIMLSQKQQNEDGDDKYVATTPEATTTPTMKGGASFMDAFQPLQQQASTPLQQEEVTGLDSFQDQDFQFESIDGIETNRDQSLEEKFDLKTYMPVEDKNDPDFRKLRENNPVLDEDELANPALVDPSKFIGTIQSFSNKNPNYDILRNDIINPTGNVGPWMQCTIEGNPLPRDNNNDFY